MSGFGAANSQYRKSAVRAWRDVGCACVALAVVSLVFVVPLPGGVEGVSPAVASVRLTAMELANSGTVWAGIAVCAGWRIARAGAGALAGVCAAEGALLIHYTLGIVFGVYEPGIIAENAVWLLLGVVACAPLGVCGWVTSWRGRSSGWRGRLNRVARLVVPVGAIVEPHARGAFSSSVWGHVGPQQHAEVASGVLLMMIGVCAAAWVLRKDRAASSRS